MYRQRCCSLILGAILCTPSLLHAEKINYSELENGDSITIPLDQLLPTQAVLDYDQIFANLQRYKADLKNMYNDLCRVNGAKGVKKWDDNSIPTDPETYQCTGKAGQDTDVLSTVVIGPEEGVLYLTEGLTLLSTFWDMPNGGTSVPITVKVNHNLLGSGDDFWAEMNNDNEVWLVNEKGKKIKPDDLPEYIGMKQLKHDKYLSLVNFLNGISYKPPKPDGKDNKTASVPFLALNWALELRQHMKITDYDLNDPEEYATALTEAATIMVDLPDDEVIGKSKRSASEMGQLDQVDSKALEELVTNENSAFGLALAYRLEKKEKSTPKAVLEEQEAQKEKEELEKQEQEKKANEEKAEVDKDAEDGKEKQTESDKEKSDKDGETNE
ncbi:chromosome partitioning protein ParB [Photobacterium sp. BZF1]|uniref:ParB/Srx family N-terminal domain-containing protein n=1 Tax=Photobacterium sp. BZF1 TaxID=1904457 RepID=UPI001653CCA2|nr:ParB/Srx family N-terminal domain-containing protein [Photobacterium sp. BZF1]MBC7002696.1 chromosome partitioning protein ParB [Photobacterium sp. BZF1]